MMSSHPHHQKQGPAFNVPVLLHTAPEAEQPHGLKLPLMPHQLRALNRCLVIEQDGSLLNHDFGHRFDYKSRGGCLADFVGTGKTATSIGLVLSGKEEAEDDDTVDGGVERGGTLVVAPAHLIPQWKHEIHKFAGDSIQVLVGKEEYYRLGNHDLPSHCTRRIVLVAVDDVLNEPKLWYDWRRVFTSEPGKKGKGGQLIKQVPAEKMEVYRKAALFSVKSPKGPCTYSGWVYTGLLHLPHKPWRRVIYDEIQDLVSEGTESQKSLLQLSRTAQHVWLLSATPFPHGNSSVYANHELLGFCRLRLDIPTAEKLPADHVFERIKRQIYIRSPRHVADQAVTASQLVTRTTQYIPQLDLEERFYNLENISIRENHSDDSHHFDPVYYPLRQMTVHPEASEKLRSQMSLANNNNNNNHVRPVSAGSVNQAGQRAILAAKARLRTIEGQDLKCAAKQLRDATRSLELAEKILVHRARPVATSVFAVGNSGTDVTRVSRDEEKKIVHGHYCACTGGLGSSDCYADRKIFFRIMRDEHSTSEAEFIHGVNATEKVIQYLDGLRGDHTMRSKSLQHYITSSKRSVTMRKENLETREKEKRELLLRIETLSQASKPGAVKAESDALAAMQGSKPAALVRFLQTVTANGEQVIVFSYWHDTLKLIGQTLSRCGLRSVFCSGNGATMALALQDFTTNVAPILLLSAQSKASGANLQCAAHVILLDPAGSSAEHGSTLEEQAVGRAVRMGQLKPVTVTRFCVTGTIEEELFSQIDSAAVSAKKGSCAKYVIIDFNIKAAAAPKREENNSIKSQEDGNVISLDDGNDAAMPPTSSEEEEKEDDFIECTDTVSPDEQLRRKFQNAQENGNVICLDPDDDKEDCDPNVKLQPITGKRRPHQDVDQESKKMRRREQQEESQTSSLQSDPETATNANVTPAPPGSAVASVSSDFSANGTPDGDHGNSGKSGFSAVRDLLRRLDLSEYTPKFLESGFDNLDWLYQFSQDPVVMEKLATTVGFKPGHAVRFQFGLSKEASTHSVGAASTAAVPESSWI